MRSITLFIATILEPAITQMDKNNLSTKATTKKQQQTDPGKRENQNQRKTPSKSTREN